MALKIVHNAMTTQDKDLEVWARLWMEKQRAKARKKLGLDGKGKKPRA